MASSMISYWVSPYVGLTPGFRTRRIFLARSAPQGADPEMSPLVSVGFDGAPEPLVLEEENEGYMDGEDGNLGKTIFEVEQKPTKVTATKGGKECGKGEAPEKLELLWDDGFGTLTTKDYLDQSKELIRADGGPPRWFCPVECGQPMKDSPVLLFLPGFDGTGLGLILHHKTLGRVFGVRCLHIPVYDRTPFEGLVELVEETIRLEHASSPRKPIYIVGDSFGGCLALAVAARNPAIDLVLILSNPATSFGWSQLRPILPALEALPEELHFTFPYLLSLVWGESMKMAMVNIDKGLPPRVRLQQLCGNHISLLPRLLGLADVLPKETLLWKVKLLKSGASYANSRLHAVTAEVLVLASGKDNILPSIDEAQRLVSLIKKCRARIFKDNGHALLLEDGINLLSVIKGARIYRRSRTHDLISDFLPPSIWDYKAIFEQEIGILRNAASAAIFSTLEDGTIVRGLEGVPSEGPVLLVGNHMLLGLELYSLVEEFLREKNIMVRGLAHPGFFKGKLDASSEFSFRDWFKLLGAVPVTPTNLFKLISAGSHVLLYPGGTREALHSKGEEYSLFWPDQPEFIRMAARFGATIVPFGVVGEDDLATLVLDYDELIKAPLVNGRLREWLHDLKARGVASGQLGDELSFLSVMLPKIPGRVYHLFGKPIETRGREEILIKDRESANELYLQIKSEVQRNISYLLKKREEDPYRNILDRAAHRAVSSPLNEIPSFKP